jgi:hypothetical protein
MGFRVLREREQQYQPRKGLEGPFFYVTGQVLYYDPTEGKYWDPRTDFYMSTEEMDFLHEQTVKILAR